MSFTRRVQANTCSRELGAARHPVFRKRISEVAERAGNQAAFDQFHSVRALAQPLSITRPGEFSGPSARTHHRPSATVSMKTTTHGVGAGPGQDDQFQRPTVEHGQTVERGFRIGTPVDDILRHHGRRRIVGEFEVLGVPSPRRFRPSSPKPATRLLAFAARRLRISVPRCDR